METTSMHIESLPDNLLLEILSYLPVKDRCVSGRVCRRWRKIVLDNSLWRHIDLLPYQLEPRRLWKLVKAHASDRLQVLRVRGVLDRKSTEVKPPLTEAMMHHLREACPNLWCFHMEPGNVTNIHTPVLPHSLTHLTLRSCTWRPQWLADCRRFLPHLVYLDLSDTVRVDNQDMKDVAALTGLRTLKLDNCYRLGQLPQSGLQGVVKALTQLTYLSLRGCDTCDLVVHHLSRHLTCLEHLDLSGSKSLTESALPGMAEGLTQLRHLVLDDCDKLTASALSWLCRMKSLTTLSVVFTKKVFCEDSVLPYRNQMPLCNILI
ncbi:F-box/LRR-repeat protein 12-like [Babylonia areolata]|uniref:F-box/LRR-repeat protein 12-like n=1 Tax=Babylonia areolata TaxID=304850 RepID=UPI003FD1AA83